MSLTRAAAWAAGVSTIILALVFLYDARGVPFRQFFLLMLLGVLSLPAAITLALAQPDRPLARAALAVAHALPFYGILSGIWFYAQAGSDARLPLTYWTSSAFGVGTFVAALAWAIRPGRVQTIALRICAGTSAAMSAFYMLSFGALQGADIRAAAFVLTIVPLLALAIGLPRPETAPPTTF